MYTRRIARRGLHRQDAGVHRRRICLSRLLLLLAVTVGLSSSSVRAQPSTNGSSDDVTVSAQSIEAARKQAADSTDLDANAKQQVDAVCAQALDALKRVAELQRQTELFKRDADEVQKRVGTLRRRLAESQRAEPSPPTNLTLPQLEQEVSAREVALSELKAALAQAEVQPSARASRRREIRTLLLSGSQRLADIQDQLETPAPADELPLLTSCRQFELQARRKVVEAEQPALQNELAKYDAEDAVDYLQIERDLRRREVTLASAELEQLQMLLSRRRAADSAAAVQRARAAVETAPSALKSHAEQSLVLAEAAQALSPTIEQTHRKLEATKSRLEGLQTQFTITRQRVSDIGLTGSIGAMLRRHRADLPDLRRRRLSIKERRTLIEDKQYELFEYDDLRSESIEAAQERMLAGLHATDDGEREKLEAAALWLAKQRRGHLDSVIRNYNTYLDALFELDASEQRLIRETQRFRDYVDERVLWIRSNRTLFSSLEVDASEMSIIDPARWAEVGLQLQNDAWSHPLIFGSALFAFALLLWRKRRFRLELEAINQVAVRGTCCQFSPTLRATLLTLMLSIAWPGIVCFLAWRLNTSSNGSQLARAISQALFAVSWVYFPLEFLRRACRPRGLADSHFDWPRSTVAVFNGSLQWATLLGLPIVFATSLFYFVDAEHGADGVERVCFASGMLLLAAVMRQTLHPDSGVFQEYLKAHRGGWFDQLKLVWYSGSVLVPLGLAGMTVAGYYYTAQQLIWRFYASFVFVIGALLLSAILQRLLLVQRRAISIQLMRERRAAEAAIRDQSPDVPQLSPSQIIAPEELQPDVAANTEQSRRLMRTGLIAASLVGMWLIWVDVLPALRLLDQWPLWTTKVIATAETDVGPNTLSPWTPRGTEAETPVPPQTTEVIRNVTIADLGFAVLIGIVTVICARNVPGLMEISVLQRLPLDKSFRYAVTSVTSYGIMLLGVVLAFNAVSVGWSKVQWLATALTFGLAFGLQEIFANFVAGIILLFEQPIRVGDVVTVDDVSGVVSRIRIRATTITNWDRKEYVIPNKEFITGRMLNWTLSDKTNRIVINVGVAYGSDVERAKELLRRTCQDHPLILKDPPTLVTFEGFGDNCLNLVVRTFLPDLDNRLPVIDELHTAIDRAFRQSGVEIAFPQRDLHVRSIDQAIVAGFRRKAA